MSGPDAGFAEFRATYRLQFHQGFTFRDAAALVPYLAELGISHLYASPVMEARPGSTHGYDIINHNRLNPEIGSEDEFRALVAALHARGMGLILDIVPNHMGIGGRDNVWWLDVLEWGKASPYATYFDINWEPARPDLKNRILLPVLGEQYGVLLERGEIALRFAAEEGTISAWYYDHRFPISPLSYAAILERGGAALGDVAADFAALRRLPAKAARHRALGAESRLAERAEDPAVAIAIAAALAAYAGTPGRARSFQRLHRLLEAQAYRIADWHVASEEINYRRFFNINDLAGLRIELPELFAATHELVFAMIERGEVQGVRVDHIDGLFDPAAYCAALREHCGPSAYIVVEKILAPYERLPEWPIAGSTGYDFVGLFAAFFVDPAGEAAMTGLYRRLTGRAEDFDSVLYATKKRIMQVNLASEMNMLASRFHHLAISDWRTRDFTYNGMLSALEEVIAAFPVYRTYVEAPGGSGDDRRYIDWAVGLARKRWRRESQSVLDFIQAVLTGELVRHPNPQDVLRTAMQFQQVTGPVMAKACEDTAFYRYHRLLALNEVGADPRRFGMSVAAFHRVVQERARSWPRAMVATATHDTKRGEDARIRVALLSEMPRDWGRRIRHWLRLNRRHRAEIDGETVPGRNVEYFFYQTLIGVWPPGLNPTDCDAVQALAERVEAAMIKSVREGKEHSGWSYPNAAYEAALRHFVRGVLDASRPNSFLVDYAVFVEALARPAAIASLAQLVLKLTIPGVPDINQGGELWDLSLVDPDNRRAVDFEHRRALLREIAGATARDLAATWQDGREKLYLIKALLGLRRDHPELFAFGNYQPLEVSEAGNSDRICAFTRHYEAVTLVVVVPRLVWQLYGDGGGDGMPVDWGAAEIPLPSAPAWHDILTGRVLAGRERIRIGELLENFPVCVLSSC